MLRSIALVILLCCFALSSSTATIYLDSTSFQAALGTYVTDHYSPADGYPAGFAVYSDVVMSAYFGETSYLEIAVELERRFPFGIGGQFRRNPHGAVKQPQ